MLGRVYRRLPNQGPKEEKLYETIRARAKKLNKMGDRAAQEYCLRDPYFTQLVGAGPICHVCEMPIVGPDLDRMCLGVAEEVAKPKLNCPKACCRVTYMRTDVVGFSCHLHR